MSDRIVSQEFLFFSKYSHNCGVRMCRLDNAAGIRLAPFCHSYWYRLAEGNIQVTVSDSSRTRLDTSRFVHQSARNPSFSEVVGQVFASFGRRTGAHP